MGDTGPQGPCSEIHYFIGDGKPTYGTFGEEPAADGSGWMEIWNLVFMQFFRDVKDGPLTPLPRPSIDTGAGLERVAAVLQGKKSNYDTDLLRPLVDAAADMAKKRYGGSMGDDDVSMRVLADHARATSFLIADGVQPSNEGRGYTLRRIMRRAIRHGVRLGLDAGAFSKLCGHVITNMATQYPELVDAKGLILRAVDAEDDGFRSTLERGLKLLGEQMESVKAAGGKVIPGDAVFKLYDTFGFPADLTQTIAEENQLQIDEAGFETAMARQKERSADFVSSDKAVADIYKRLREELGATEFVGYAGTEESGKILVVLDESAQRVASLVDERQGEKKPMPVEIIADRTPFYGESGGQVGDVGVITGKHFKIVVTNTLKPSGDFIVHKGELVEGAVNEGEEAAFTVDVGKRNATRANHSATHLLHWALKRVLGEHVAQKGSLVGPDRLRFDFSHFAPMTDDEKRHVEDLVNDEVRANAESVTTETSYDEARKHGAVALFGEKYGDRVRVMKVGHHSVELCGGTHVHRAGDIGLFKITSETGIAQGIRRLEAQTGAGAIDFVRRLESELARAGAALKGSPLEVAARVEKLQGELKERQKEIEDLRRKLASGGGRDLVADAKEIKGVMVIAARSEMGDPKALREVADELRNKLKSGIVVLGGVADGKVSLVAAVTADLAGRFHAGKIVGALSALVGGKGGGRPDMAQGGGTDPDKLDAALAAIAELL